MLLTLLRAFILFAGALSCRADVAQIYKYGDDPESAQAHAGTLWTYDAAGDDWTGRDAAGNPWICLTGQRQSPINLPSSASAASAAAAVATEHRTNWQLGALQSNGTNVPITNNGHSVQVSWSSPDFAPQVSIVLQEGRPLLSNLDLQRGNKVQTVVAQPRQFHFHTSSEHLIAGSMFPLEAHLVSVIPQSSLASCPPQGCTVVTAVLFELAAGDTNNTWLQPLFNLMPDREGEVEFLPDGQQLDLQQLVPSNTSYIAYSGSFTTPPCTEGVLWMVFVTKLQLSVQQWRHFMRTVGDYNCTLVNDTSLVGATAQPQQSTALPADVSADADAEKTGARAATPSTSSTGLAGDGSNDSSSYTSTNSSSRNSTTRVLLATLPAAAKLQDVTAEQQQQQHRFHPHHAQQQPRQWQSQRYHLPAAGSLSSSSRQLLGPATITAATTQAVDAVMLGAAAAPAGQHYVCSKLGAGQNSRMPQPLNARVLRVWRDAGSGKKSLLPEDAATAAGAGAIAGIVLGTTLGATLTGVIGFFAYKAYQRRRLKRLYNLGVSSNDMMMVQQEVESQWLREPPGGGDSAGGGGGLAAASSISVGLGGSMAPRLSPRNQAVL